MWTQKSEKVSFGSFVLYSRDCGVEVPVNASAPSVTIGRLTGNVCPDDREVSRTQVQLSVSDSNPELVVMTVLGINHSAVFKGGTGEAMLLHQGERMSLRDGDVFLLSKERWEWEVRGLGVSAGRRAARGQDDDEDDDGGGVGAGEEVAAAVVGPKGGSAVDSLFLPSDAPSYRPTSQRPAAAADPEPLSSSRWSGSMGQPQPAPHPPAPTSMPAPRPRPPSRSLSPAPVPLPVPAARAVSSKVPTPLPVAKTIVLTPLSFAADHQYSPEHALHPLLSEIKVFLEPRRGQGVTVIVSSFPAELLSHPLLKGYQDLVDSGELVIDARSAVDMVLGRGGVGVVGNACNWRLKRGAAGTLNRAVFDAAGGEAHEKRAKETFQLAKLGEAYLVPTEPDSTLSLAAGVRAVIHALGPTMNPASQDSLGGDYEKADALLRSAYRATFGLFWKAATGSDASSADTVPASAASGADISQRTPAAVSAISGLPKFPAAPAASQGGFSSAPKSTASLLPAPSGEPFVGQAQGWTNALFAIAQNPRAHAASIIDQDEHTIVIRDKYPKARVHLLILCRADIPGPSSLTADHLPVLEAMAAMADRQRQRLSAGGPVTFLSGFHAVPSLRQLHLHLLTSDLESECLKHKKHFNSFTTPFLVDVRVVIWALRLNRFRIDADAYENYLSLPLTCFRCRRECSNIPSLKEHLKGCRG